MIDKMKEILDNAEKESTSNKDDLNKLKEDLKKVDSPNLLNKATL